MSREDLSLLEAEALTIATEAHRGQVDKGGCDYIEHPKAVAARCTTRESKIVALLHDTIEDTYVTADYLRDRGFPEEIVRAVVLVTKDKNDPSYSYMGYLRAIKKDPIARVVKLADLAHNMDLRRIGHITFSALKRQLKYQMSYQYLAG